MPEKGKQEIGKEAIARITPIVLSDLNQPLSAIDNYVQAGRRLMERGYVDEETLAALFDKLDGQVCRCYKLLRDLRQSAPPPIKSRRQNRNKITKMKYVPPKSGD